MMWQSLPSIVTMGKKNKGKEAHNPQGIFIYLTMFHLRAKRYKPFPMWVLWKDDFETFVPRAAIKRLPETHRNNKVIWTSEEAMAPKAKSTLYGLKEAASTGIPQRNTTSSVPEHCDKVNAAIKQVTQFFWFRSTYKCYVTPNCSQLLRMQYV